MANTQEKQESVETVPEKAQTLELVDKDLNLLL